MPRGAAAVERMVWAVLLTTHAVVSTDMPQNCLSKHNIGEADAFGISIVKLSDDATVPALPKRVCATTAPAVPVQYSGVELNVLNMTASREQCLALYTLFVCQPGYPYTADVHCGFASEIAYAFIQRIPACETDADCRAGGKLQVPHIHCKWADAIRAEVCPRSTLALQCVSALRESFALDGEQACALTSPLCATVIVYTNLIATLAAATYCLVIAIVIYTCSEYRKNAASVSGGAELVFAPPMQGVFCR